MEIITLNNKVVNKSRNLRGMMEYARKYGAKLSQDDNILHAQYGNGATLETTFADESVLKDWIAARIKYGRGNFT